MTAQSPHIVALLGLPGSGKSEAVNYLMNKHNWPKVYFGQITFIEMDRRGLPHTQENERLVREDLRRHFGKDHYANEVVKLVRIIKDSKVVLVESLYSWTEFQVLKKEFGERFLTIAIHASPSTRHARLMHRPVRPLTKREAEIRDEAQIEQLEQGGPIALANYMIVNEHSRDHFHVELDSIVEKIIS